MAILVILPNTFRKKIMLTMYKFFQKTERELYFSIHSMRLVHYTK